MDEAAAREVVLVQAFETAQPVPPSWSEDDRAWATRLALQEPRRAGAKTFIARRAQHALQRLGPREPTVATWLARRLWRWRWVVWAVVIGLLAGALADSIGSSQRINLLAPPLWAVLVWNVVVYVVLLGHGLARLLTRRTRSGGLLKLTERALRLGRGLPGLGSTSVAASASGSAQALQAFASEWLRVSAPLSAARAATLLHAAAAALALGLIAGLYVRGLVLDYRVAWESTFLSGLNAHAILASALSPAAALSGLVLPDVAAFEAMRSVHDGAPGGAPAATWIHLLVLTLALVVVLPRSVLAIGSAARAHWLARHLTLPMQSAYFQRLVRAHQGEIARVFVAPYAHAPGPQAARVLHDLLAGVLGDGVQIASAPTFAFGAEDATAGLAAPPADTTLAVALFDLAATPEQEHQGRFACWLATRAPTILLIEETGFVQRFKADPARLAQRRDAWRVLAVALGTTPVFVNSDALDDSSARGVTLAVRNPVSPPS